MKLLQLSHITLGLLVGISLSACGDDGGGGGGDEDASVDNNPDAAVSPALASLSITTQPVTSAAGDLLTITVEARDANDSLITDATSITLSIESNPSTGTLGGTLSQMTTAGVATFDDVFVDKVGLGYTLLATSGAQSAETEAFDITVGALAGLGFVGQPANVEAMSPMAAPVSVQFEDAFGNAIGAGTGDVTIRLANNAGQLIAHSSGNGPAIVDLLDPTNLQSVGWYESFMDRETRAMMINPADGLAYVGVRSSNNLFSLNLATDEVSNLGATGQSLRGMVFDPAGAGRVLSLDYGSNELLEVDFVTATSTSLGPVVATPAVESFAGMSIDPSNNSFYAIALTTAESTADRRLVIVDPVALTAAEVGTFSEDGVSAITFAADGSLFAITGEGATNPNSVFSVDKTTAVMTLIGALDNLIGDGEFVSMVPARLLGTTTVAAVDGVASFADLRIDAVGTGYTLEVESAGSVSAPSAAFNVTALQGVDGVATLDVDTQTVSEDVGAVAIAVSIDVAQTHDVVLTYSITGGAANDTDSNVTNERFFNITIPAGATTASRSISIVDDAVAEGDETIGLSLENSAMANGVGAITTHTITITDND